MLILSIKVSEPINTTFPTTPVILQSVSPKIQLSKHETPKTILTHSTLTGNFVQLDGQGDLSNILTVASASWAGNIENEEQMGSLIC